jgi:hypothetical protein
MQVQESGLWTSRNLEVAGNGQKTWGWTRETDTKIENSRHNENMINEHLRELVAQ